MKTPADIFSRETFNFLSMHAKVNGLRLLEVGCGEGDFAALCKSKGAEIVAIDVDEEAVSAAIEKGVNARHVDFIAFEDAPFDVIIFTRSLHHIHNLKFAVERAVSLTKPDGILMLEEFDVANINEKTARWYYDIVSVLSAAGLTSEVFEDVADPYS